MPVSDAIRAAVIALHQEGLSCREIAQRGLTSCSTVARLVKTFKEKGHCQRTIASGRPRLSTKRQDRVLVRQSLRNRFDSSVHLQRDWADHGVAASSRTIRRRLQNNGLVSRRPVKKPLLSKKNLSDRFKFCRTYRHWTADDWGKVIFSDECPFSCFGNRGGIRVRRRVGEKYQPQCLLPTMKHPETVNIWGCFSAKGLGSLAVIPKNVRMNKEWYLDVLEHHLIPTIEDQFGDSDCYFQDDGAPCHRAKVVKDWFTEQNIGSLVIWPGNSPDLNPIENLWGIIGKKIRQRQPRNSSELVDAIKVCWHVMQGDAVLKKLIDSMPQRIEAVLRNKGFHCKY